MATNEYCLLFDVEKEHTKVVPSIWKFVEIGAGQAYNNY